MTEFLEQHFEEMENEIKGKCAKRTREARGERLSAEWLARQKPVPVYLAGRAPAATRNNVKLRRVRRESSVSVSPGRKAI